MANLNPYSNYGYFSLKKETTAGSAVQPDEFIRIIGESIIPSFGIQSINEVAGSRERNVRSIQNMVEISGDVEFFVEESKIGHFLRAVYGAPVTQTVVASTSYRHGYVVKNNDQTYTFDIKPAGATWVHRFFGVHVSQLQFAKEDNAIKCTASVTPTRAFITARVTADVSSGTTLTVDQTTGLTTSDTILVLQKEDGFTQIAEYTIASIDSETQLTVSTISDTLEDGDIVVIKANTSPSYSQCEPFQFMNGTTIYVGDDIDNTAAVTKEDFEITVENQLEPVFGSGNTEISRYSFDVLVKGYQAGGKFDRYFDSEYNIDKLRSNDEIGVRYLMQGKTAISANSAQKASSTWGTTNGFKVEASTAGRAGNDIAVTIIVNTTDTLEASKSGNHVLIKLANTTASKNTGTLIAAAVNALSGVDGTAEGTGAEQFTAAEDSQNLGFRLDSSNAEAGTNVVGADASEKPYLQFDFAAANFNAYFPNIQEDETTREEIELTFFEDNDCNDQERKKWSTRIFLFNDIASY